MGSPGIYDMSAEVFEEVVGPARAERAGEDERRKAWFGLSDRITSNWDGMRGEQFFGALTPGQFAVVVLTKWQRSMKEGDVLTFPAYSSAMAGRLSRALEIVGAEEYAALWRELQGMFEGGVFPVHAEGWQKAMRKANKLPEKTKGMAERFVKGRGWSGLWGHM